MAWRDVDLGAVSAYAVAVANGYKGTAEEWAQDQENAGKNAGIARTAADTAVKAANEAKEALESITPGAEAALQDIADAGAAQIGKIAREGDQQIQQVRDAGAEQSQGLSAQGEVEKRKVTAEGDTQVGRINSAGDNSIEAVIAEGEKQKERVTEEGDALLGDALEVIKSGPDPIVNNGKGAKLNISDAAARDALNLKSHITPIQSGSGTPAIDNKRTISGRNTVKLTREANTGEITTLDATLPETVYGGILNWTSGVLTVTHALATVTSFDELYTNLGAGLTCGQANKWPGMRQGGGADGWCEVLPSSSIIAHQTHPCISFGGTSSKAIYAAYPAEAVGTTLEELNAYVAENPLKVVYPLETPYELKLGEKTLEMLKGSNALESDSGDTEIEYVADTKMYIDNGDRYADVAGRAFEADSADTAAHAEDADTVRGVDVIAALAVAAGGIVCDAGGDLVSVADAAARNVLSAVSAITPVQSGSENPSPDNVRPISGWDTASLMHAGRNLARYPYQDTTMTRNGITFTDNGDGTVTANGTATDRATFYLCSVDHPIHLKKGCSYTLTGAPGVSGAVLYMQDTTFKQMVAHPINPNTTITADYSEYYMFLRVEAGATLDNAVFRPMLVMGDTAQEFEPYQGQTLSADMPETVYGGTLDWVTGKLTVTHIRKQLTGIFTSSSSLEGYVGAVVAMDDMLPASGSNGLCDMLMPVENKIPDLVTGPSIIFGNKYAPTTLYAFLPESLLADNTLATFNAYFNVHPATIVYPLETPYTIQLTPQQLQLLKGNNALWSTTGDTSLAYIADTKLYIDNAIAAIAASMIDA